jgi:methyl-accepting chemotaxis protein
METESQPPAEVIDLMSSIASKYGEAARAQSSNGHEGGAGAGDPLAQLTRSLDNWGRTVQQDVRGVEQRADAVAHRLEGIQYELHGVKQQADRLDQQAHDVREQARQTLMELGHHATRIDGADAAAQDAAGRLARLEAAVARGNDEVAQLRAAEAILRRRAGRLAASVTVAIVAIVAVAVWVGWPEVTKVVALLPGR